jgi:hypothetical protein
MLFWVIVLWKFDFVPSPPCYLVFSACDPSSATISIRRGVKNWQKRYNKNSVFGISKTWMAE